MTIDESDDQTNPRVSIWLNRYFPTFVVLKSHVKIDKFQSKNIKGKTYLWIELIQDSPHSLGCQPIKSFAEKRQLIEITNTTENFLKSFQI